MGYSASHSILWVAMSTCLETKVKYFVGGSGQVEVLGWMLLKGLVVWQTVYRGMEFRDRVLSLVFQSYIQYN